MPLTRFAQSRRQTRISPSLCADDYDVTKKSYQPSRDLLEDDIVRSRVRERSLIHRYYPSEFKPTYSPDYIHRLTRAAVARAEQTLIRGRVAMQLQSPLAAAKTMDTERIMRHLYPERKHQIEIDENRLAEIAYHEYLIYKHRKEKPNKTQFSDDMKRLMRGKSPTSIASALLAEAENNIKADEHEEEMYVRQAMRSLRSNLSNPNRRQPYVPLYKLKCC